MRTGSNISDNYWGPVYGLAWRGLPDRLSTVLLVSHLSVRTGAIQGDAGGKVSIRAGYSIGLCEKIKFV
jgi:hypothetical protein